MSESQFYLNGSSHFEDSSSDSGSDSQIFLNASDLEFRSDHNILSRTLQPKTVIFTRSSYAHQLPAALAQPDLQPINVIGRGSQGTVFEHIGRPYVIKKENIPRPSETLGFNIHREYHDNHMTVHYAFSRYRAFVHCGVRIPTPLGFIESTDREFWSDVLPKFPPGHRRRANAFKMERILPLPKITRRALISHVYGISQLTSDEVDDVLNNHANKHCLVRPLLGKEFGEPSQIPNCPLSVEWIHRSGMDILELAKELGRSLALLHWAAGVDGAGVKYVLGTRIQETEETHPGFQHRAVGLYLLDFGSCTLVNLESDVPENVYQIFVAGMMSEGTKVMLPLVNRSVDYFRVFREAYCEAGTMILCRKSMHVRFKPESLMERYVAANPDSNRYRVVGNAFRDMNLSRRSV